MTHSVLEAKLQELFAAWKRDRALRTVTDLVVAFDPAFESYATAKLERGTPLAGVRPSDIAQEAHRRAIVWLSKKTPEDFETLSSLLANLYRIVLRVLQDLKRRQGVKVVLASDLPKRPDQSSGGRAFDKSDSHRGGVAEIMQKEVLGRIEKLPLDHRQVITLHYVEGKSVTEIANRLGKCDRRVYALRAEGLQHMREILGADWNW